LTIPLLQSFDDPEKMRGVHLERLCAADQQPSALSQESQQQKSRQDLRPAKTFACEKFTHEGTASVLPCSGTIGETSIMDNSSLPQPADQAAAVSLSSMSPPEQEHPMHKIFIGPHGLRAGWRLLLYVALWRVFAFLLEELMAIALPRGPRGIWLELAVESKRW
jgi:hypothetical protein